MKRLPDFKLKFHGVRGSRPVHHADYLNVGGNSTCIELNASGEFSLFIDAGTGLANRAKTAASDSRRSKRYHILITHTHWDHILTIPWFEPLFDPEAQVTFYASQGSNGHFEDLYHKLFTPGHVPQPQGLVKARVNFVTVSPNVPFTIESSVRVVGFQLNHQAVTLGFKLSYGHCTYVVVTDTAPINDCNYLGDGMTEAAKAEGSINFERRFTTDFADFARGADILVFDSHFNEDNLKADWGHSTARHGLELCRRAGINRLILFHHSPEDDEVGVLKKLQAIHHEGLLAGIDIAVAKEEDEWTLKSA